MSLAPTNGESVLSTRSIPDLLADFEATGNQAPFEEIVRRYAGMVYNVCYQVSKDAHDAEDATQAVFLTLAVRSKTSQKIQYLGPWLQRVAQRLSLDMKRSKRRRSAREMKHHDINIGRWEENNEPTDLGMDELRGILRDEIDRLPAKYRAPLILHYFGGLKPEEMSTQLGIKSNTLGVRLHRARKMLGESLQKRGVVVGGAMLSTALATLIPLYIQHTLASGAHAAAASNAIGQHLVAQEISNRIIATMQTANRAAILAKIKAVTAAIAIGAAAVAGGREIVQKLRANGFELPTINLKQLFAPFFDNFRSPFRLGSADKLDAALDVSNAPKLELQFAIAPQFTDLSQNAFVPVDVASDGFALASPLATIRADSLSLERTPIAAPISIAQQKQFWSQHQQNNFLAPPAARVQSAPTTVARIEPRSVAPIPSGVSPTPVDVSSSFARARGSFEMNNGSLRQNQIVLDSQNSALRSFHLRGGDVRTNRLTIADAGRADFVQDGGSVTAPVLEIGVQKQSQGSYQLNNGQLHADTQKVGIAGEGKVEQAGGSNTAKQITLGDLASGNGEYTLRNGSVFTNDLRIGVSGVGSYTQYNGSTTVDSQTPTGGVTVAELTGSRGSLALHGGTFTADRVFIGLNGDADAQVNGAKTITNKVVLGSSDGGTARLRIGNGELVFNATNDTASTRFNFSDTQSSARAWTAAVGSSTQNVFAVGLNGDALVEVGNSSRGAVIREGSDQSRTSILIAATPGSNGVIRGHGDFDLRDVLVNNGKIIADGFGRDRVLDFSSVSGVRNTVENDVDGANGYYAQRGGSLPLPAIKVARDGDYNWGESPDDRIPDLVNSVRVGFNGVTQPGQAKLALLAPDLARERAAAPDGEIFVGLWKFDRVGLEASSTDLLVRYDEQIVEHIGLSESALSLWAFDGDWEKLTAAETVLDAGRNLIGGTIDGRFEYFAVSLSSDSPLAYGSIFDGIGIPGLSSTITTGNFSDFINDVNLISPDETARGGTVPEPGALTLVAVGTMIIARRRRR